jgi:hypothetical protein
LYTVERILQCKPIRGINHYKIKWVGYPQSTWEPASNLSTDLIHQYHERHTMTGKIRKHGYKYFK